MIQMKARNIHPDYILFRNKEGKYERYLDPGAWNFSNMWGMRASLIRHENGEWVLHS
jgi:hypothetical protein